MESAQFHFWEYINGNQTFMLDSHWPFICSVEQENYYEGDGLFLWGEILEDFFSFIFLCPCRGVIFCSLIMFTAWSIVVGC